MSKNYYNLRDSYKLYSKNSLKPIEIKVYLQIVNGFMKFLMAKLFQTGEIIIPERMGRLQVIGKKIKARVEDGIIKGLAPDWANTNKLWEEDAEAKQNKQLVFHFNEETDGIRYKFFWSKKNALISNKTLYNLRMTRTNKRALAQLIKEGKEYLIKN